MRGIDRNLFLQSAPWQAGDSRVAANLGERSAQSGSGRNAADRFRARRQAALTPLQARDGQSLTCKYAESPTSLPNHVIDGETGLLTLLAQIGVMVLEGHACDREVAPLGKGLDEIRRSEKGTRP